MASAKLQITVESVRNLYNSDGILAGKSDPYVIVEVPGQKGMKFQTQVTSNELNPVWNFTGEIDGFMDGDVLCFTVMDKDTFPKSDDFLGKAALTAQDFYPHGFHGELTLADSKTQAALSVMVVVIGCDQSALELVEGEGARMMAPGEVMEGTGSCGAVYSADVADGSAMLGNSSTIMYSGTPAANFSAGGFAASSTAPAVLAAGVAIHGLPVYDPGVPVTSITPRHSTPHSALQTPSAPQVPMNGMVTTSTLGSQSIAGQSVARQSMASQSITSQSITYAAPQALVPNQCIAATGKVVVHPPVTVTAEEFAKINGTLVTEPLPVTVGIETVGVEANQEIIANNTEAVDETVKIKKNKKSKQCC